MNRRLVGHLLRRVLRPGRLTALGALAAVPWVVFGLAATGRRPDDAVRIYHEVTATLTPGTLSIAVLVVAVAVLREERDAGTLAYLYLQPIRRSVFAASALVAGVVASTLFAAWGWTVGWGMLGLVSGSWTEAVVSVVPHLAAAVGYGTVFVPLGYLVPRAVLVGLGYVFVWEGIVATLVEGTAQTSVWRIVMSIYADLVDLPREAAEVLGPVAPGVWGAAGKLAGVAVVAWAVLWWALQRRDAL